MAAKETLTLKQIPIYEIQMDVGSEAEREEIRELFKRTTNASTVPQIFIGHRFVGPNSALQELENFELNSDLHPVWGEACAIRVKHALKNVDF